MDASRVPRPALFDFRDPRVSDPNSPGLSILAETQQIGSETRKTLKRELEQRFTLFRRGSGLTDDGREAAACKRWRSTS